MKTATDERTFKEHVIRAALAEVGYPNPTMWWTEPDGWSITMGAWPNVPDQMVWRAHFLAAQAFGDLETIACWPCWNGGFGEECEHTPVWV